MLARIRKNFAYVNICTSIMERENPALRDRCALCSTKHFTKYLVIKYDKENTHTEKEGGKKRRRFNKRYWQEKE